MLTIGGTESHLLYGDGTFRKYKAHTDKWSVEVRGHIFMNQSTELDYKMTGKVDSFARGIQMPMRDFSRFARILKDLYKDIPDFSCQHYKCSFFDMGCTEYNISQRLSNFTLRFNDSFGYTIPPEVYLAEGKYTVGDTMSFKTCDFQIYGHLSD